MPDDTSIVRLHGDKAIAGNYIWTRWLMKPENRFQKPRLEIIFSYQFKSDRNSTLSYLMNDIEVEGRIPFIEIIKDEIIVDIDQLKKTFKLETHSWLKGKAKPEIEFEIKEKEVFGKPKKQSVITLAIGRKEVDQFKPKRIFLSHKSANKPLVRKYFDVLELLGLSPWLDEKDMVSGHHLNRSLLKGMSESCAAVFFITPDYVDENFLADEIDYAKDRKMQMKDEFSLIVLQMEDKKGNKGVVPSLLTPYVYKTIKYNDDLVGLYEILRALPFEAKIKF